MQRIAWNTTVPAIPATIHDVWVHRGEHTNMDRNDSGNRQQLSKCTVEHDISELLNNTGLLVSPLKKPRKHSRCLVIQEHHIRYATVSQREWKVTIYKGEHWILTRMQWRRRFSKGFITALEEFIRTHKEQAVELHTVHSESVT
jgi:hypothetical protein